tara:strand:- start:361 stop:471 length:111 start_codon:yes stop_codon:yes gene_type:complete
MNYYRSGKYNNRHAEIYLREKSKKELLKKKEKSNDK